VNESGECNYEPEQVITPVLSEKDRPAVHLLVNLPNRRLSNMSLADQITADMTAAMKAKEADRLGTLRMVKANLMNRKIEKGGDLTDEETTKALQSLVKQRRDSIEQYKNAGRDELVQKEAAEIAVIETYLPQAATLEEIAAAVEAAVNETRARSMKDMGATMKLTMTKLEGKSVDGKAVSEAVKARLNQ